MKPIMKKTSILAASMLLAMSGAASAGPVGTNAGAGANTGSSVSGSANGAAPGTNLSAGAQGNAGAGAGAAMDDNPAANAGAQGSTGLDADAKVGGQGSHLSGSVGAQSNAGAGNAAGQPNQGTVISSINSSAAGAQQIRGMQSVGSVKIVQVDSLSGDANGRAVENAVSRNETDIDDLRAAIETNSDIKAELDNQGVDMNDVIAAQTDASGNVTVFTRRS